MMSTDNICFYCEVIDLYFRLYHFNSGWVNVRKAIKFLTKSGNCSYMGVEFYPDGSFTVCVCFMEDGVNV
nr:MAG TPA: hypothetical protein [Bacteriophage sp.]